MTYPFPDLKTSQNIAQARQTLAAQERKRSVVKRGGLVLAGVMFLNLMFYGLIAAVILGVLRLFGVV